MKLIAEGKINANIWKFFSTNTGTSGYCHPILLSKNHK
jgi:hypothetical protein